ncbi:MAG: hypothetical protein JOZ69_09060 [Myxococcales bacterium]|nr:hypothetical protein [Myxococcales bacterium]
MPAVDPDRSGSDDLLLRGLLWRRPDRVVERSQSAGAPAAIHHTVHSVLSGERTPAPVPTVLVGESPPVPLDTTLRLPRVMRNADPSGERRRASGATAGGPDRRQRRPIAIGIALVVLVAALGAIGSSKRDPVAADPPRAPAGSASSPPRAPPAGEIDPRAAGAVTIVPMRRAEAAPPSALPVSGGPAPSLTASAPQVPPSVLGPPASLPAQPPSASSRRSLKPTPVPRVNPTPASKALPADDGLDYFRE